jgi:hypothetical protein
VEDVISAIKLSKLGVWVKCLFGTNINFTHIRDINPIECVLFLDPDMHIKTVEKAQEMRLNGFRCSSVLSEHDPKEYTYEQLKILTRKN